ncbi:MAG: glucuronate isomerase [Ruminococcaceae bacterium]|nr:glucuronate isomerase [Oscillospiraceae bacterium]
MEENFLLHTNGARAIYDAVKDLPLIDFHNHISVSDIAADRRYEDLCDIWLSCDPYKHRLMRICGIDEHYITGDASGFEKYSKFCEIFPLLAGNPVYDWSRMELSRIFGIEELPSKDTARVIWDTANERLRSSEYSTQAILSRFCIEYQSPVAALTDDLSCFDGKSTAPSLRGDNLLLPDEKLLERLKKETGKEITDTDSYIAAVSLLLDRFSAAGCRFADHSLDTGFFEGEQGAKKAELLCRLGVEYAARGWTLLLHIGAKRKTSERLARLAGPAGGYAAAGKSFDTDALCDLLGSMETRGGLPDTVLFPLNMSDQAVLAVMQGSFSEDGTLSKVQLGPAWWWCDHAFGIEHTLSSIASFGVLSAFIGMTTDSRSILSFVRHDYFRRLLASWIDTQNTKGDWALTPPLQAEIARRICYENAKEKIKIRGAKQ